MFLKSVIVLEYPEYILRHFKICLKILAWVLSARDLEYSDTGLAQNGQIWSMRKPENPILEEI